MLLSFLEPLLREEARPGLALLGGGVPPLVVAGAIPAPVPARRNLVNELFRGQQQQVTTCHKCKRRSARTEEFFALSMQVTGFKRRGSVAQSLLQYVGESQLDGDNKYFCSSCARDSQ